MEGYPGGYPRWCWKGGEEGPGSPAGTRHRPRSGSSGTGHRSLAGARRSLWEPRCNLCVEEEVRRQTLSEDHRKFSKVSAGSRRPQNPPSCGKAAVAEKAEVVAAGNENENEEEEKKSGLESSSSR